jgi:hypothetical protein
LFLGEEGGGREHRPEKKKKTKKKEEKREKGGGGGGGGGRKVIENLIRHVYYTETDRSVIFLLVNMANGCYYMVFLKSVHVVLIYTPQYAAMSWQAKEVVIPA